MAAVLIVPFVPGSSPALGPLKTSQQVNNSDVRVTTEYQSNDNC